MAAAAGKPVKFTQVTQAAWDTAHPNTDPAPFVIVGEVPVPVTDVIALTAVPGSFADLAAVRTYLVTLVAELKSSDYFS